MKVKDIILVAGILLFNILLFSCTNDSSGLISTQQEVKLGKYLDSVIIENKETYPVLDTAIYRNSYQFIDKILDSVLASKKITRSAALNFTFRIINKNEIDFFSFPGGFLYLNTGFLKYLENSSQLAGVLAHQAAHIDQRHLTAIVEEKAGIDALLNIIFSGNKAEVMHIYNIIMNKPHSIIYTKKQEEIADEYAVRYTLTTKYDPLGIYYFLEKVNQSVLSGQEPDLIEMHPVFNGRTDKILEVWGQLDSIEGGQYTNQYLDFLQTLP